jgi:ABC-2 type transport system permease protein
VPPAIGAVPREPNALPIASEDVRPTRCYRGTGVSRRSAGVVALHHDAPDHDRALWHRRGRRAPLGHYSERQIVAYFLATFIVRSLTASWVSWQINLEIRDGTLASRLLLPMPPLLAYAAIGLGSMPVRVTGSVAMAIVLWLVVGTQELTHEPLQWALWVISIGLAWALSLFVSSTIGALAFFFDSSAKVMDAWLAGLFVFSGYLIPVDLFPKALRTVVEWLPFRYQIGLPVELMLGVHSPTEAISLVGRQVGFVLVGALTTLLVWRRGLGRYAAFGG